MIENNIPEAKSITVVDTTRRAFELLARGRTDVVVSGRLDGTAMLAWLGIENVVRVHEQPLASLSL